MNAASGDPPRRTSSYPPPPPSSGRTSSAPPPPSGRTPSYPPPPPSSRRTSSYPPGAVIGGRSLEQLVDYQVRLWAAREEALRLAQRPAPHWPVVTLSREFGTAGARIGERLAELLGFAFWDKRVLEAIAERVKTNVLELDALDERAPGAFHEFLSTVLRVMEVPSRAFHDALSELVRTLERRGSAVIVGRGAGHIVDPSRALRVRVTAPLQHRVEQHAKQQRLDLATAREQVTRVDKERQSYIEHRFHARVDDPLHYDFVLNVSAVPIDRAAELLREVYRTKFSDAPKTIAAPR